MIKEGYEAGGEYYNAHLAGGSMYYAPNAGAILDNEGKHISSDAYKFSTQTDALEHIFNLLPLVSISTEGDRLINFYAYIANNSEVTITSTQTLTIDDIGNSKDIGTTINGGSIESIVNARLDTAEAIGANLASAFAGFSGWSGSGLFPSVAGVVAVDVLSGKSINVAALSKMTLDTVTSQFSGLIAGRVTTALGVTNIATALSINIAVGMVFQELVEIGLGLDNSFGFGGEYMGTIDGERAYKDSLTLAEGLRSLVGIEKPAGTLHNWDGEIIGAYINSKDEDGNELTTTISERTINSTLNTNIAPTTEETMDYGDNDGGGKAGVGYDGSRSDFGGSDMGFL